MEEILGATEYPGNHAIPEPAEEYYLFAGEIGWSPKYGGWLRRKNGRARPQLGEAFRRTEHRVVEKSYGELSRSEKAARAFLPFHLSSADARLNGDHIPSGGRTPASQIVKVQSWVRIPGVTVELPSLGFTWESYHSEENKGGHPNYAAPSIVEYLRLRKAGAAVDLVEESGRLATVYREARHPDGFRANLLYLRLDLLEEYLARTGRLLVWINWGERTLHYSELEHLRDDAAMRPVWDAHAHIHRQFVTLTSPLVVEFSGGPAVCCGVVEVVIGPVG